MYRYEYIFNITNNTNNNDKHIIEQLRKYDLIYIMDCYKRYNELNISDKNYENYIINHTYLYILDNNDDNIFSNYIENNFNLFFDFFRFYTKYSTDEQQTIFFEYLYNSLDTTYENSVKTILFCEVSEFIDYIIKYENTNNITLNSINSTILNKIIHNHTCELSIHYINILIEYSKGNEYILHWFSLFYTVYRDILINIHTETLLDIDIYHRVKKVYTIIKSIYNNINKKLLLNFEILYDSTNYLGYCKYDVAIVSSYNKNLEQLMANTFDNQLIFTFHRYNEMLTLLHLSKFITLSDNKNNLSDNETTLSNINITIQFLQTELFSKLLYETFDYYDYIASIIINLHENHFIYYKCIPDSFIKSIFDLVIYIDKCSKWTRYTLNDFNKYLNNITKICYLFIEDKDNISNPYIRMNSLNIINILSSNNVKVNPKILSGLLDIFIQLEMFNTPDQFYEKFRARRYILTIIKNRFNNIDFKEYFINYINHYNTLKLTRIFYLLFNDFNYQIEDLFEKVNDNHIYVRFSEFVEKELQILNNYQTFLCLCIEFCKIDKLLLDDYIKIKFVHSLNYNINLILNTPYDFVKDNPLLVELYFSLIGLYHHFDIYENFLDCIIFDNRTFTFDFLKKIKLLFIKLTHLDNYNSILFIQHINEFIYKIKKYSLRIEYHKEIKDDLLDPITYEPITNPVVLPSSGIILDKWTICNHLLSNESDPFNRELLTINILEDFNKTEIAMNKINQFKEKML